MYIMTITARRKDAKRHVVARSDRIKPLERLVENLNGSYIVDIYTSNWKLVKGDLKRENHNLQ